MPAKPRRPIVHAARPLKIAAALEWPAAVDGLDLPQSPAISCWWRSHRINIIETPGTSITIEVERSLRVLDGAVTVFDSVAGVQVKPATVSREVDTLSAILNDAVRTGRLERSPSVHIDRIKGIVPRQRFLDPEETTKLLEQAEKVGQWFSDFILWSLHSGMRKGETLGLQWKDVRKLPYRPYL